ncbi:MAG: insulinase family protein [Desulfobacterales bacterium]|jgi:zinc protease|nr:insulinase family protein [Desulfobacteraceae bacterium]MBT4365267.1 insulinase family protein [Desulfobacteraceae bacterium]MBT7084697.1 insulinase family protein [Desulfobacterales bacterium]MBT7697477.1 insulinase family protein [Desulfobacterales bacterium]
MFKRLFFTLMFVFYISLFLDTYHIKNIEASTKWPHDKSDLLPDQNVKYGKLSNGFRYVLMENNEPKDRVSMHLNVQAGSVYEKDDQQGTAHFLEHILFCGSENFKPGELVKYFQSIGMQFGGDANAHTGFYETVYDLLLPDGSRKSIDKALLVLKDYAEGALILQSEVEREKKVVLSEKRTRDSASYRTFISTLKFELPGIRLSNRLPIGTEVALKKASRSTLKKFYDTWYRPETMILVIVGSFDTKLTESLIVENFSALSPRDSKQLPPESIDFNHKGIKPFYHFEGEAGKTSVTIEIAKKITHTPDTLVKKRQRFSKNIADRIINNRLEELVSKPETPFTAASISSGIYFKNIEFASISADCSPENWEKSLSLIEHVLRRSIKFGFNKSELDRVKKEYISGLDRAAKGASTRKSQSLSRKIVSNLNNDRVFQSPEQRKKIYTPLINSLTLEKIHESFIETWETDHRLVLVTGNADLKNYDKKPEEKILEVINKSALTKISKPEGKADVVFPYLKEPAEYGEISYKEEITDLGIILIDFQNGLRLNLKKTDFKADEVLVTITFGHGRSGEPSDKPGLANLSSMVINESGLGKLNKDDIERALAGRNTSTYFSIEEERFALKGRTVTKEVPLLFQLLYSYIKDPGYRKDAYLLSTERFRQRYLSLSHDIEGAMALSGKRFLAGGDSRFGLPDYDTFKKNTLNDIRNWFDNALNNEMLEISIVGDFDTDLAVKTISKYFGTLPSGRTSGKNKNKRKPVFPEGKSIEIKVPTQIQKGIVEVAYPTEDFWNIHRTRRLSVLGQIFSERVRVRIREKLGSAYSSYAYNKPYRSYPGYGIFHAVIHVDPEETNKIIKEIKNIASDLSAGIISDDEFRRALDPILTGIKDKRRTNSYWLNSVLTGLKKHPEQLDWSRTFFKDYASVTISDVKVLAEKYLDNKKAATIKIVPE